MTKHLHMISLVFAFALPSTAIAQTQDKPAPAPATKAAPTTAVPLKVQILISRYQGEKKISSMPYTLSVSVVPGWQPGARANLRMGAKVPVVTGAMPVGDGKEMRGGAFQYQDVGTNVDCNAQVLDDGRFRLEITVDDTSIFPDEQKPGSPGPGTPSFRSFRASDSVVLKDGQTAQFTTATDKVSGETVKIDVTLTVLK